MVVAIDSAFLKDVFYYLFEFLILQKSHKIKYVKMPS